MKGKDRIAEGGPAFGQDGIVVRPGMVKPADDHGPGHANALAFTPQGGGSGVDAVNGRHYEQSRIRGTQPRAQLSHEIGVARGVEKVHFDVVEDKGAADSPMDRCWWMAVASESLTVVPSTIEPMRFTTPAA
ncbi:hypothetical protein AHiyo1_36700 [Arthrobacter sp. Hiyo1]|nr:hypothetical protein AHiyo1_36700 [Arthrobacter sp. Hiyo1]